MKRVDPSKNPYLRILFYGDPGSTKTRTAGTAVLDERLRPVLHLSARGNPLSIRDYVPQPTILEMDKITDFNDPYDWLKAGQPASKFAKEYDLQPAGSQPYKTVIVDGVTEVQRMSFNAQRGEVAPGSFPTKVERQHFYNTLGMMVNFANLYFSLPMHVIMTSLEAEHRDEVTGAITYTPLLWGQSESEVGGYAYVVARLVHRARLDPKFEKALTAAEDSINKEIVSVALFKPSGKYIAKDQYGTLGAYMVNPTLTKMLDLIGGQSVES